MLVGTAIGLSFAQSKALVARLPAVMRGLCVAAGVPSPADGTLALRGRQPSAFGRLPSNKSFKPNSNRYAITVGLILVLAPMSEDTYSVFILALILLSFAGLVWAIARFDQMAAMLGVAGYWGRLLPTTRTGMSLVMVGSMLLGLAALPPSLAFYPESWRNVFFWLCGVAIGSGFIHDFVAGAVKAYRDGR